MYVLESAGRHLKLSYVAVPVVGIAELKHYVGFRVGCRALIRVCVSSWNFVVVVLVMVPVVLTTG